MILDFLWKSRAQRNFETNVNREYDKFHGWLISQPVQKPTVDNLVRYFNHFVGLPTKESPTFSRLLGNDPASAKKTVIPKHELKKEFFNAIRDYEHLLTTNHNPHAPTQSIDEIRLAHQKWDNEPVCRYCGRRGWVGMPDNSCKSSPHGRHEILN
ncbi:MAG: hypothetical protein WCH99_17015 [Verrucomicrobiota bacterium]